MPIIYIDEPDEEKRETVWDPEAKQRCIVCNRLSDGMAICTDERCAQELAQG